MGEFFPSICWVPKGCCALLPKRAQITAEYQQLLEEELKSGEQSAGDAGVDEVEDAEAARIEREYNLQDYDNDEADDVPMATEDAGDEEEEDNSDLDPEDEAAEDEDFELQESDNLLVVAQVREQPCIGQAQVHVYNEPEKQFYLHHDFYLDSLPLCFEWVGGSGRNLLAIGRMEPTIQLWDLDVVDSLTRLSELGQAPKKKKKKKQQQQQQLGHSDAVLDLAWNCLSQQALASAAADSLVCLWDLEAARCLRQLRHHSDKAQAVRWHPVEQQLLLSGSYDSTASLVDCRDSSGTPASWTLTGECERLQWDTKNPWYFYCTTDKGALHRCDARVPGEPLTSLVAHEGSCCGLGLNDHFVCTAGADGLVKLWRTNQNAELKLLTSRQWPFGEATKLCVNPDCGFVLAVSGTAGYQVWDIREDKLVRDFLTSQGVSVPSDE